jgi:predicted transposase YdaD
VLDTQLVAQILRWDMVVLRESPWYQEILQEGESRGRQAGVEEGERSLILKLLVRKFGEVPLELRSQIEALSVLEIEALGEAFLDFSAISDLTIWLQARQ